MEGRDTVTPTGKVGYTGMGRVGPVVVAHANVGNVLPPGHLMGVGGVAGVGSQACITGAGVAVGGWVAVWYKCGWVHRVITGCKYKVQKVCVIHKAQQSNNGQQQEQ